MAESLLSNLLSRRYTIGDILAIDQQRVAKSQNCQVNLVDTFFTLEKESVSSKLKTIIGLPSLKVLYVTLKLNVVSDTGNAHTVFITLDPDFDENNWERNRIKLYCGCRDFMYRSAYHLNKRNSLFDNELIKIKLGKAITEAPKGKSSTTSICKHSYAAIRWVLANYSNIMKNI